MCGCVPTAGYFTSVLLPLMGKWGLCKTTVAERQKQLLRRHPASSRCFRWTSGRGGGGPSMAEVHFITQWKMRKHSAAAILSGWETCGSRLREGIDVLAAPRLLIRPGPPGSSFPLRCAARQHGTMWRGAEPWWETVRTDYTRPGTFPVLTSNLEMRETWERARIHISAQL